MTARRIKRALGASSVRGHRSRARIHFGMMLGWAAAIPIAFATHLADAIWFVTAVSLYANVLGHGDGWAAESAAAEAEEAHVDADALRH